MAPFPGTSTSERSVDGHSWASSPAIRRTMQGNRRRDTSPELKIRRLLHARGLRYRIDQPLLFDRRRRADIVFPRQRLAVFIDGCFWHRCPKHYTPPKSNAEFWDNKTKGNQERDADTQNKLESAGWTVLRFWEHEDPDTVADTVESTWSNLRVSR